MQILFATVCFAIKYIKYRLCDLYRKILEISAADYSKIEMPNTMHMLNV